MTVRGLCAEFLRIMKYEIWQSFVLAAAGLTMISMEVLSCRRLADNRLPEHRGPDASERISRASLSGCLLYRIMQRGAFRPVCSKPLAL